MVKLIRLFEPIKIGKLELKNRIVMPALNTKLGTEWGAMSDRMIDYYAERAKGGVGLIIIENTCIDWPVGKAGTNPIRADEWKFIQGLHDLAEAIHVYGAKIATQLHHAGRQGSSMTSAEGQQLVAPSPIPCLPTGAEMPRELTLEEIEAMIGKYIFAATITKAAGFDAVEVHGAHGYLISQFMSPYTNKREDEYGKDFEGRIRFPLRIIEGIKMATGPDFPIIFRISADEYMEGGLTLEDNKRIAQRLEPAGVDAFNVSAGIYESPPWFSRIFPTMGMPQGCNVPLAQEIKKVVRTPVIVAGKLGDPVLAEKVLREGKADLIAMGRPLLADPELPRKAYEGRAEDIRPCIYCNEACAGNVSRMWSIGCVVNPALGREKERRFEPARKSKRVLVVGGGPAGMEAARIASLRGHSVTLVEQQNFLGGQLLAASAPQFKQPIRDFIEYLKSQVKKRRIKVMLGKRATPALVKRLKPDVVVVAAGATHCIPDIPGAERGNVATASDILTGKKKAGKEVAIIGGGEVGAELAWHLAEQGKKVNVVEMLGAIAMDMNMFSRLYLMDKLGELGVNLLTGMTAQKITSEGVLALDDEGKEQLIKADKVIFAAGFECDKALEKGLKGLSSEVYCIGDCVKPGKIEGAISSAWRVASQI